MAERGKARGQLPRARGSNTTGYYGKIFVYSLLILYNFLKNIAVSFFVFSYYNMMLRFLPGKRKKG